MSTDLNSRFKTKFEKLTQEGRNILRSAGFDGRSYPSRYPSEDEYIRFRTECLNLVKKVAGTRSEHYGELRRLAKDVNAARNSYYFHQVQGALEACYNDFKDNLLIDVRTLVSAEVLGDFIDQAEALAKEGYFVPAASLAGAVLEDFLRKLSDKHGILYPAKTRIDSLNSELARASVYDKLVQKRITALADIRNNADHGHFDKFKPEDIDDMIQWTRRFAADYLH